MHESQPAPDTRTRTRALLPAPPEPRGRYRTRCGWPLQSARRSSCSRRRALPSLPVHVCPHLHPRQTLLQRQQSAVRSATG